MQLTANQVEQYNEDGFLVIPNAFSELEVAAMKAELTPILAEDSPRRVREKNGTVIRSVYGSHQTNELFGRLTRHPMLLGPAKQLLNAEVYVYQFKINIKAAFGGDIWEWHQDYVFWRKEDGMPKPDVTNIVVLLDEVTEFNGPVYFIPGSHKEGMIDVPSRAKPKGDGYVGQDAYSNSPQWISNLTADLKYSLDRETVTRLVAQHGIVSPKAPAGSLLLFHCNLFHGSPNNISPQDRTMIFVTYNNVANVPPPVEQPRPEFLVSRDATPLMPLSDAGAWFSATKTIRHGN